MSLRISHAGINIFLLALLITAYPFHIKFSNAAMFIFVSHWFLWLIRKPGDFNWKNRYVWLLILPYILCAVSLFYSANFKAGVFVLDKKIGILLLPIALGTMPRISAADFKRLMTVASVTATIALAICFCLATYRFFTTGSGGFFWKEFSDPLNFHPTYFALYINILMAYLGLLLLQDFNVLKPGTKLGMLSMIVLFIIAQFLLSSKIQLVCAGLILVYFVLQFSTFIKIKIVVPMIILVAVITLSLSRSSYTWERFTHIKTFQYELAAPTETFNEFTIRLGIIDCALRIVKDNLIFGVGAGDISDELDKKYRELDFKFGYMDKLNPHNEYLSQLLGLGLLGLAIFLFTLGLLLKTGWKRGDRAYIIFLLLMIVSFAFESMLERQKGIILFSLFNSLFLFHRGMLGSDREPSRGRSDASRGVK